MARRPSFESRLIGLSAVMLVAIVGVLSVSFSLRQIRTLRVEQTDRVRAYGTLLAHQLRSAVAFGDRETAREVLDTIDPRVVAVVLYGDDGRALYVSGDPDAWTDRVSRGVLDDKIVRTHGRVSSVARVSSLEGPEGTLVVQMSTAATLERQHAATMLAVWIGLATLAAGVGGALWIARSFGDRTRQLSAANVQLVGEMERRAAIEVELRQAQKLESVGRLASGVAHEINTPLQYVSDSVHFVQTAFGDVMTVLDAHRAGAPDARARERELDLPFLRDTVPESITTAIEGIDRVVEIVRSLKTFAHPDRPEMAPADLNAAIASTLTIARNEYKYSADVVTAFGELPPVTCHLGEINQVVLNLVVNAAHAIQDVVGDTGDRGKITVTTREVTGGVEIDVADTGGGIADDVRTRIFEPFFTTKDVGRGTGQGLAIARSVVVDKHRGRLTFASDVGTGSTFTVFLPRAA
nr:ATP-binding protein [Kofleriaceae bacterium]